MGLGLKFHDSGAGHPASTAWGESVSDRPGAFLSIGLLFSFRLAPTKVLDQLPRVKITFASYLSPGFPYSF